ncbi:hypothetical protein M9H77_23077 [Catharanthus roseus]|uniref:Uncharacterized protein n=1 Tax=Catharanthus roseus TaxID=4058 RepID=A0ACC0AT80_CATRO|nr:hypothetical protein M9H77_23077 [Catharanthus roseus]
MAEHPRALRESFTSNTYNSPIVKILFLKKKVLSALKGLEVKTEILDSQTQSIAKLETQIGQLANAISSRDEGRLPSHPIENLRANYHEKAKAVITLRNGKEVDNKVGEPIKDNELNENETEEIDIETKIEKKTAAAAQAATRAATREKEKQPQDGHNLKQQI